MNSGLQIKRGRGCAACQSQSRRQIRVSWRCCGTYPKPDSPTRSNKANLCVEAEWRQKMEELSKKGNIKFEPAVGI